MIEKENWEKDTYLGWIPFQLLEAKLFADGKRRILTPCYKVKIWETKETFWLAGYGNHEEGITDYAEYLRKEASFIRGTALQLRELIFEEGTDAKVEQQQFAKMIKESNDGMKFLKWRYDVVEDIKMKDKIYVGVDFWGTPEGMKFCISGSNWFLAEGKEEGGIVLKCDGFMFQEQLIAI